MPDAARPCIPHLDLVGFNHPLPHLAASLKRGRRTRIVAIGSSSTAGEGKILPYPCRLELSLRDHHHGRMIDVLNRGIGGQEVPDELARFEPDVIGEAPALLIWQVGTNAVFRKEQYNFDDIAGLIATGLQWLAALPIDVVLMDPQYTTAIVKPGRLEFAEQMVALVAAAAEKSQVNLFKRFALMRRWCIEDKIPIAELIDPTDGDQLHMSDWATHCMSDALDSAIARALAVSV